MLKKKLKSYMFLTLQKKFQTTNAKHSAVSRSNLQEQQGGEQEEKIWLSLYFIWIFPNMYSWVTYMIKKKKDTVNFKIFSESPSGENVKEKHILNTKMWGSSEAWEREPRS